MEFVEKIKKLTQEDEAIIYYMDESGFETYFNRARGWSLKGSFSISRGKIFTPSSKIILK